MSLEQKLGFDRVRGLVHNRCQSLYAQAKVADEDISRDGEEILARLRLTDEMRTICLFEDDFPVNGYIDTRPFLVPLDAEGSSIDLPSLGKLRTALETLRQLLAFFGRCKEDLYPSLRAFSADVAYEPEIARRIAAILDRNGRVQIPPEFLSALELEGNRVKLAMEDGKVVIQAPAKESNQS